MEQGLESKSSESIAQVLSIALYRMTGKFMSWSGCKSRVAQRNKLSVLGGKKIGGRWDKYM